MGKACEHCKEHESESGPKQQQHLREDIIYDGSGSIKLRASTTWRGEPRNDQLGRKRATRKLEKKTYSGSRSGPGARPRRGPGGPATPAPATCRHRPSAGGATAGGWPPRSAHQSRRRTRTPPQDCTPSWEPRTLERTAVPCPRTLLKHTKIVLIGSQSPKIEVSKANHKMKQKQNRILNPLRT
jgi:hypothetical protein